MLRKVYNEKVIIQEPTYTLKDGKLILTKDSYTETIHSTGISKELVMEPRIMQRESQSSAKEKVDKILYHLINSRGGSITKHIKYLSSLYPFNVASYSDKPFQHHCILKRFVIIRCPSQS